MKTHPVEHPIIVSFLNQLGFRDVRYYDVGDDGVYYDAVTPSNVMCEVYVKLDTTHEVGWRALGVQKLENVEWHSLGKLEKVKEPPKPQKPPKEELQLTEEESGQLSLF